MSRRRQFSKGPPINADVISHIIDCVRAFGSSSDIAKLLPPFWRGEDPDPFSWGWDPFEDTSGVSRSALYSLCLVSKLWLTAARRSLYRIVPPFHHGHRWRAVSLARTIRKSPDIRPYVRQLHITSVIQIDIISLLPRCDILICPPDLFNGHDIPESLASLASITALKVRSYPAYPKKRCHDDFWTPAMSAPWALLQVLDVEHNHFVPDDNPIFWELLSQPGYYSFPSLRELRLHSFTKIPNFHLAPNTLKTMIIYNFRQLESIQVLVDFIHCHWESLTRLVVQDLIEVPINVPSPLENLLGKLTHLEDLSFGVEQWIVYPDHNTFRSIPWSVQRLHLVIRLESLESFCVMLMHIEESNPMLKSVELSIRSKYTDQLTVDNACITVCELASTLPLYTRINGENYADNRCGFWSFISKGSGSGYSRIEG